MAKQKLSTVKQKDNILKRSDFKIKKCKCSKKIKDKKVNGNRGSKRITTTQSMVVRLNGSYDMHTHLKSMFGARKLLELILKGEMPMNPYLNESARRILMDEEFSKLELNEDYIYGYKEWKEKNKTVDCSIAV